MINIPKSTAQTRAEQEPGTWRPVMQNGELVIQIKCPLCNRNSTMRQSHVMGGTLGHDIDADGIVNPSISCPHDCSWHVFGRLEGW